MLKFENVPCGDVHIFYGDVPPHRLELDPAYRGPTAMLSTTYHLHMRQKLQLLVVFSMKTEHVGLCVTSKSHNMVSWKFTVAELPATYAWLSSLVQCSVLILTIHVLTLVLVLSKFRAVRIMNSRAQFWKKNILQHRWKFFHDSRPVWCQLPKCKWNRCLRTATLFRPLPVNPDGALIFLISSYHVGKPN